jgi:hypothetical protein
MKARENNLEKSAVADDVYETKIPYLSPLMNDSDGSYAGRFLGGYEKGLDEPANDSTLSEYLQKYLGRVYGRGEGNGSEQEPLNPLFENKNSYAGVYGRPYSPGLLIRKVPRYILGYHVLGRTFPSLGIIEIAMDLYGDEFEEVKLHELTHFENPEQSEYWVRKETRRRLLEQGKQPAFH